MYSYDLFIIFSIHKKIIAFHDLIGMNYFQMNIIMIEWSFI